MKPACLLLAIALAGCSTVVPTTAPLPAAASFDGGAQTSGILAALPDSSFVVTAHLRGRYNALIVRYGGAFVPALQPDSGLTALPDNTWGMTPEAMVNFVMMVQWYRMGRPIQ